jgi:hypothetical protein
MCEAADQETDTQRNRGGRVGALLDCLAEIVFCLAGTLSVGQCEIDKNDDAAGANR